MRPPGEHGGPFGPPRQKRGELRAGADLLVGSFYARYLAGGGVGPD